MIPVLLLLITTGAVVAYWDSIVEFVSQKILPWLRNTVSPSLVSGFEFLFTKLDNTIVGLRRRVIAAWQAFSSVLLGSKRTLTRIDTGRYASKTETYIKNDEGKYYRQTEEEEVGYTDLPEDIRAQLLKQKAMSAQMDMKEAIRKGIEANAAEAGEILELAH